MLHEICNGKAAAPESCCTELSGALILVRIVHDASEYSLAVQFDTSTGNEIANPLGVSCLLLQEVEDIVVGAKGLFADERGVRVRDA